MNTCITLVRSLSRDTDTYCSEQYGGREGDHCFEPQSTGTKQRRRKSIQFLTGCVSSGIQLGSNGLASLLHWCYSFLVCLRAVMNLVHPNVRRGIRWGICGRAGKASCFSVAQWGVLSWDGCAVLATQLQKRRGIKLGAQVWRKARLCRRTGSLYWEKRVVGQQSMMKEYESGVRSVCGHQEWRKAKKTVEDLIDINSPSLNVGWKLEEQS